MPACDTRPRSGQKRGDERFVPTWPHWHSQRNLAAAPFANGAGVPQMGKNDPVSGKMEEVRNGRRMLLIADSVDSIVHEATAGPLFTINRA